MVAHQAPPSLGFSRQEHWSGLPFPSPMHESENRKWSRSVVSDSSWLHGLQPTSLLRPWDSLGKSTGVGCHCLLQSDIWWNVISEWSVRVFLGDITFESESWVKQMALPNEKRHHPMYWGSKQHNNNSKTKKHWLYSLCNCWAGMLIFFCPQHSWFLNFWTQTRV